MTDYMLEVLDVITGEITATEVVAVIAGVVGVGIVFVAMWWAVRYGIRKLMGMIKKGKISG